MKPWLIIAALALAAVAGVQGYRMGVSACEARHVAALAEAQAETLVAITKANAAEAKRLAAEQAVRVQNRELEDLARAEPVQSPACLPASRVLRLNKF
ncbi:hypothetical protein [Cypionkella aquatica]|uniref:hypothetical protein n=1 Tax=Cypionkella aquatica TaxID=1756042 RepID=UPI0024E04E6F|nr:hypothetical protein [Cypionkella aquatica]